MSTTPLPQPQQPDQDGTDALAGLALPTMGQQIAKNTIAAGQQNHGDSRDWAENAVAGVQSALAGIGAGEKESTGWLSGIGRSARAQQAQRAEQQKAKLDQEKQLTEEQLTGAQIAHLNADTYTIERAARNSDRETMQKLVDSDVAASEPYVEGGIVNLGEHLTSDDLSRMLKPGPNGKSEVNGHEVVPFKDGITDEIGKDGRPILDPEGNPVQRPTYRLFDANGQVQFDDTQAKFISDNTPYHPQPGSPISVVDAHTMQTLAKKNQTFDLSIQKVQSEIGRDTAEAQKAEGETKNAADEQAIKQQAAKLFTPYLAAGDGDPWKAIQIMGRDPKNASSLGIVEQAYGPGNIEAWHEKQQEAEAKQQELALKKQGDASYEGDPNAASPQAFLASLGPEQQATIKMIGEGRVALNSPTYLLARKPEIMDAVAKAYPGFDASKVKAYQDTYKDFTSGKTSIAINSGATALQHLAELRQLNTNTSRVPGTKDYQAYQNKVNTVAPELARFYGNDTDLGVESMKQTLDSTFNRDSAITTQAKSMGDKMDSYEQQWANAAPSPAYQASMPGLSQQAKLARANLDPSYAQKIGLTHRVFNKADEKYHWTDPAGKKDLGVAQ